jgi:hypothetical protein
MSSEPVIKGGIIDCHGSSTVCLEMWENQRYKPMGGGWGRPFDEKTAYSDINGESINVVSLRDVILKPGWEWSSDWVWDMSGFYGETDEEGWSYATTFEDLFATSRAKCLSGQKKPMTSLVRRRRLLRQKQCVAGSPSAVLFTNQLKWQDMQSEKLHELLGVYSKDVEAIMVYDGKRSKSYVHVIEHILDRRHQGAVRYCNQYMRKSAILKCIWRRKGLWRRIMPNR